MQDLSHLVGSHGLTGGESMQATNTVSDQRESMTAPGSASEATSGIESGTAGPEIPPVDAERVSVERAHDVLPEATSRSMIRRGEWNNI